MYFVCWLTLHLLLVLSTCTVYPQPFTHSAAPCNVAPNHCSVSTACYIHLRREFVMHVTRRGYLPAIYRVCMQLTEYVHAYRAAIQSAVALRVKQCNTSPLGSRVIVIRLVSVVCNTSSYTLPPPPPPLAVLVLFLTHQLDFNDDSATGLYHAFIMLCYLLPLMGAIISDSCLGKYWSVHCITLLPRNRDVCVRVDMAYSEILTLCSCCPSCFSSYKISS